MSTKTVRHFSYYLFENFDPSEAVDHPLNPRSFLNNSVDGILSWLAETPIQDRLYTAACARFGKEIMDRLLTGGIVRREQNTLFFDTPVFLAEDAAPIKDFFFDAASRLAEKLMEKKQEFYAFASELQNGFSAEVNLYHILCGMCFDGMFLDKLSETGVLAGSRPHASGLDYLAVIYEKCPELDQFSDGILCSYNRVSNEKIALQSFGNGNGNRLDCYRYFRLRELGKLTDRFAEIDRLMAGHTEADLLQAVTKLFLGDTTLPQVAKALNLFGYTKNGNICVPVFLKKDNDTIRTIETALEDVLLQPVSEWLSDMSSLEITATTHNVAKKEIANECWHILFGSINEILVSSGFVAKPPFKAGEGRYLQSIELYR